MSSVTASEVLIKQPSEVRLYSMSFSSVLGDSETIEESSPAPTVVSSIEGSSTSSDLTIGTPSVSGESVQFTIEDGTHGNTYRIEVTIETSDNQTLEADGLLRVLDR